MGLSVRGRLPDGTEQVFTLPDTGPNSTVEGWRQTVEPVGYRFIELIGQGPSVPEDVVHAETTAPVAEIIVDGVEEPAPATEEGTSWWPWIVAAAFILPKLLGAGYVAHRVYKRRRA